MKQPIKEGDQVRLRKPRTEQEIHDLPFGTSNRKIDFMDEKTVYIVTRVTRYHDKARRNSHWKSNWRIYLEGVRSGSTVWSFGERYILPDNEMDELVHNVLKGLPT